MSFEQATQSDARHFRGANWVTGENIEIFPRKKQQFFPDPQQKLMLVNYP